MSDTRAEESGSLEETNNVELLDMNDSSESLSEVNVDHFLSQMNSDGVEKDTNIDDMESFGDAAISVISIINESCSDDAQTTIQSLDISEKTQVGEKSIRRNRFKRSQLAKKKKSKASASSRRLKPSKIRGQKERKRTKFNGPKFHVMQHYREFIAEESQKSRAVNEFMLEMVMKLKMEKAALIEQVNRVEEKPTDNVSNSSSDALLANIDVYDSDQMFPEKELEAVRIKLKDEEAKAKRLGDEAAILRREKAQLIRDVSIARKENEDLKTKIAKMKSIMS